MEGSKRKRGKGKGKRKGKKKRVYRKGAGKAPQVVDLANWILWLQKKARTPKEIARAYAEVPVCAGFCFIFVFGDFSFFVIKFSKR